MVNIDTSKLIKLCAPANTTHASNMGSLVQHCSRASRQPTAGASLPQQQQYATAVLLPALRAACQDGIHKHELQTQYQQRPLQASAPLPVPPGVCTVVVPTPAALMPMPPPARQSHAKAATVVLLRAAAPASSTGAAWHSARPTQVPHQHLLRHHHQPACVHW